MHSKVTRHSYISQKSPTYPRYVLINTSSDDNLKQNEEKIHQYPSRTKAGHGNITAIISMTDLNNL